VTEQERAFWKRLEHSWIRDPLGEHSLDLERATGGADWAKGRRERVRPTVALIQSEHELARMRRSGVLAEDEADSLAAKVVKASAFSADEVARMLRPAC